MGSDHRPIVVVLEEGKKMGTRKWVRWDWDKADWEKYRESVAREVESWGDGEGSVSEMEREMRECILKWAKKHIGKKVVRTRNEEVLNEEIREEIRRRDELGEGTPEESEEKREANKKVLEMIREEKRKRWREVLERGADVTKMWEVIRGVGKSREGEKKEGEVLVHKGKGMVTPRAKAEAFVKEYAGVSRFEIPRSHRGMKMRVCDRKRSGVEDEQSGELSLGEVVEGLRAMDERKAAGPDDIHPRLLKRLPEVAIKRYWKIFNKSLEKAEVPQSWRRARIIPLLKAGKDAAAIGSYRPVSLTSCIGKWCERVLASRLRYTMENSGKLSRWQTGFRVGRSVEDQLLRLTQDIDDGFQGKEKTVLALFDFARAYDKVWRDALFWKLMEFGIDRRMVSWLQSWMANRMACVSVQGVWSREYLFEQGLPQGSVLSPLLFLAYINDLLEEVAGEVKVNGFADDMAVWASGSRVEESVEKVQRAATKVWEWSKRWLMVVSVEKCSVTLFSKDVKDSKMEGVNVELDGKQLKVERYPTFLGVKYDGKLVFGEQFDKVVEKARGRVKLLRALAGRDWGWSKKLLRTTYVASVRSVLLYGAVAWTPWLSRAQWSKLEAVQREAARVITGMVKSSPGEAVLEEAGLRELEVVAKGKWRVEYEKCLRESAGG
jgi:hypothetical protein